MMLSKQQIQYLIDRYRRMRSIIGGENVRLMTREEHKRLREEWLEEARK